MGEPCREGVSRSVRTRFGVLDGELDPEPSPERILLRLNRDLDCRGLRLKDILHLSVCAHGLIIDATHGSARPDDKGSSSRTPLSPARPISSSPEDSSSLFKLELDLL